MLILSICGSRIELRGSLQTAESEIQQVEDAGQRPSLDGWRRTLRNDGACPL